MAVVGGLVDRNSWMGANLATGGTSFHTWAPNAISVTVVAGANLAAAVQNASWSPGRGDQLQALGDGSWGGFLPGIGWWKHSKSDLMVEGIPCDCSLIRH